MINAIKKFNFKNSIILKMIMVLYFYKYINNLKIIKKLVKKLNNWYITRGNAGSAFGYSGRYSERELSKEYLG